MAAAALCYLGGGDAEAICHAAALAIKSLLGLVCDPIAGLVEVPCIKRNASGAMVAMCCADMALAGIRSAVPPDEVIMAMKDVGDKMDVSLRETGLGQGARGTGKSVKGRIRKIPSESGIRLWRNFFVMADDLVRRFISSA